VTLIGWVLKILALAVLMNFLGDICPGDKFVFLETEELTHLGGNRSFLSETRLRGIRVARLTRPLAVCFLEESLVFTVNQLLELLDTRLQITDKS